MTVGGVDRMTTLLHRLRCYALVTLSVLAGAGCHSPTAPLFSVECPSVLTIAAGDNQRAPAGTALPAVLDVHAAVKPGYESMFCTGFVFSIAWSVETGGGSVRPAEVPRQLQSRYTAAWTLGPGPGTQTLRATVRGSENNAAASVLFTAIAEPPR